MAQHGFQNIKQNYNPFETRIAYNNNQQLTINIEATLPMLITIDKFITNATLKTNTALSDTFTLTDPSITDRYIFMNAIQSPLTNNVVYFFYDKEYQDIIITPNLEFTKLGLSTAGFTYSAFRLGSGEKLGNYNINSVITNSKVDARKKLPLVKSKVPLKAHLITLTGVGRESLYGYEDGNFEEMVNDSINILHKFRKSAVIVELGTANDIFTILEDIPLYLLFQQSIKQYGIDYIGNINPNTNKIYVLLPF